MNDWKEVKIEDVAKVIGGGTPRTTIEEYWNGDISWITPRDLTGYKKTYISKGERSITRLGLNKSSAKLLPKGTVLLSSRAPIGYIAIAENEISTNQGFKSLVVKEEVANNVFIYYWLKNNIDYLKHNGSGTTFAEISGSVVKQLDIITPPLQEQKAIAEVLSSLDDKIDLLHRQNETLEEMAQTLFRQWFVEEADDSWEVKKLGDIMTIASSKRIFYKEYKDFGIPFYRSKEIIELSNTGKTNSELFISEERFNEISTEHGSPQKGDILLTSVGTLGKSYRVKENDLFYFKDGNLTWFKEYDELNSDIVYAWLNSDLGQNALREITIGSTQSALTLTGLRNIELSIPPIEVQEKLNSQLKLIYEKNDTNYLQIQTLEKLRDTLLPKLMSGEVRVNL